VLDLADKKISEAAKPLQVVWVGRRAFGSIALQVFQRSPRYEISGQLAFAVTGENRFNYGEIAIGMERCSEMALVAEVNPLLKGISIPMQGEKILEIMIGEKEIWNAGSFAGVVVGTTIIVSMIKIEVGPDLYGDLLIGLPNLVIAAFQLSKGSVFNNHLIRHDKEQWRLKGAVR